MDTFSKSKRSEIMSRVRSKDTAPELEIRSYIHKKGFRFVLHRKDLPGKPDIVLPRYKTAIFVNGCFWHGHDCRRGQNSPKTHVEYWNNKIQNNMKRDTRNYRKLRKMGWHVYIAWECNMLKHKHRIVDNLHRLKNNLEI